MVIIEVKVGMRKEEVVIIIIKELVMRICVLKLNLFRLLAYVFYYRVCRWELKLIATCLTVL